MARHKDKRQFARLDTEHSLKIIEADGGLLPALAVDISLSGLQLLCDRPTAMRISPRAIQTVVEPGMHISISIELPMHDGENAAVEADCTIITMRRLNADEYRIGLKYHHFKNSSYQYLERYIDEALTHP